jgi:hypothetical protein
MSGYIRISAAGVKTPLKFSTGVVEGQNPAGAGN